MLRQLKLVLIVTLFIMMQVAPSRAAPLTQDPVWTITSPSEGSSVSGEVQIQGTATHPNFDSYALLYAPGPRATGDSQWVHIVVGVKSMVVNGTLATWNTTALPNGQYTLALAVYEVGNTEPNLHFTNNITINNQEPTPTPTPEVTETPEGEEEEPGEEGEPTLEPVAPPPAATLVQPPTATPRPTATAEAETAAPEDDDESGGGLFNTADILSIDTIKEAAKQGAQLAFLLYAVGLLYFISKVVIRYYLRQKRGQESRD